MSRDLAHRTSRSPGSGVLMAMALCGGCGEDLPLPERIAGVRPLAMRVEVVEATDPAAPRRAEALPFETVELHPFIVDPQGPLSAARIADELDPVWLACIAPPVAGLFTCVRDALPTSLETLPACPHDLAFDPAMPAPSFPPLCRLETSTPASPRLTIPLHPLMFAGGDLEVTMLAHRGDETTTPACARMLLSESAEIDPRCLYVTQRVSVGPDETLIDLASEFGFVDADALGPLPDPLPDPDAHPRIGTVQLEHRRADGGLVSTRDVPSGTRLAARAGDVFEITAHASEDDLQTFYLRENETTFVERDEAYGGRWFRTWGELLTAATDDPISVNRWTLVPGEQDEADGGPPDGTAYLFYVVRDGRQGVDWWWVAVTLEPEQ